MDEDLHQLAPQAAQFMNYCRKIALMPEDRFVRHFRIQLSTTARRQLHTFPPINSQPLECLFPWEPTGFTYCLPVSLESSSICTYPSTRTVSASS